MIFVTGDTHGRIGIDRLFTDRNLLHLTKKDTLIILGDFGLIWDNSKRDSQLLDKLNDLPYQILFVDGNHENHDTLNELPIVDRFNGKVGKVRDSIFHLKRGEIYIIENKTFFTMGGAYSIDKGRRIEGRTWWPEEMPSDEEMIYAKDNLSKNEWSVDFILSHDCSLDTLGVVAAFGGFSKSIKPNSLTRFLNDIEDKVNFKHWYFGHYHLDINEVVPKQTVVYKNVVLINKEVN